MNIFTIRKHFKRWQQRNGPIIHNVTSVKYNKKKEIFSHWCTNSTLPSIVLESICSEPN